MFDAVEANFKCQQLGAYRRRLRYDDRMKLRRISSSLTFLYKFIVPAMFALVAAYSLVDMSDMFVDRSLIYLMIAAWMAGFAYELWIVRDIKRVLIDETNQRLYVSNFRREIAIPLADILHVAEFTFHDPVQITLYLRTPCEFGPRIRFLGTYRFGGWLAGSHPIVKELRQLAGLRDARAVTLL